jgi:hypothetical protein
MATIYGYNDFTLESKTRTWTPDKGYAWTYVYRGPLDKADAFFELKVADVTSDSVTLDRQDGMGTITVTVVDDDGEGNPQNTEDNDLWEIVGQDTYRDLMSFSGRDADDISPTINFTRTGNNDGALDIQTQLAGIRKAVELASPDQMPTGSDTYIPDKYYRRLMERGVTQYLRSTIVLRRTITAGRRSNIKASWAGVDRAWKLDGQLGSPNLKRNNQAALIGVIEDHPDFDADLSQWLKKAPQIQEVGRRRYSITYEWWFAKSWSWVLYGGEGIIFDANGAVVTPQDANC